MKNSRVATAFITATAMCGLAMLGGSVLKMTALHHYQFLWLLVLGAITSRTKVKLPGIDGTMSVNLPFMMIAAAQLSLFEAVAVALVSATLQSIPKRGGQYQPVKMLFNASTIVLAAGIAALVLHSEKLAAMHHSGSVALIAACGMFFLVNTLPVATIIALTEGSGMMRIWSSIAHMSFPYYVACTGVTSMVTLVSQHVGWQAPLAALPVMLLMYRCFQTLFARGNEQIGLTPVAAPLSRAAAAR
ncbi:MAG: hypothetical protein ABSD39_18315 [Terriglobales bacterium]|jgi:hypothetical protein